MMANGSIRSGSGFASALALQASVDIEFVFTYSAGEWEKLLSAHSSVG